VLYSYNRSQKRFPVSQLHFDIQLYMFRTDLLSIIRSFDTLFTAVSICHTVNKVSKLLMIVSLSETCRVVYRNKVEKQCVLLASITRIC
jgi:hypothetical protein